KDQVGALLSEAAADFKILADDNDASYASLCDSEEYQALHQEIDEDFGLTSTCLSSATSYAVQVELPGTPLFYSCLDSTGLVRVVANALTTTTCGEAVKYQPNIEPTATTTSSSEE